MTFYPLLPHWNFQPPVAPMFVLTSAFHRGSFFCFTVSVTHPHTADEVMGSTVNSISKLNLGGLRIGPLQIHNNICKHKDGAVPVINSDRLHWAHVVDVVYFRSEQWWTYECSCQWSQTGSDTSGALRHQPHHPAQNKSESACGALRWIKEIRQFSGGRCEAKGNKANCHTRAEWKPDFKQQ